MKTSTWRWLLSPVTSVRAVHLLRSAQVVGTFNEAWVIARLARRPEDAVFLRGYSLADQEAPGPQG